MRRSGSIDIPTHPCPGNANASKLDRHKIKLYYFNRDAKYNMGAAKRNRKERKDTRMIVRFGELVEWYISQCDGLWEHQHHGLKVITLNNPGVSLLIDLNGTPLQTVPFKEVRHNYEADDDWLLCEKTKDNYYHGVCSPEHFGRVVDIFLDWAAENSGGATKDSGE